MIRAVHFIQLIVCMLIPTAMLAQGGILVGTVMDGDLQEPLAFANVAIVDLNLGSTTDLDGNYRLSGIPAGTHEVTFSYLGYENQMVTITITAGQELQQDVTLRQGGVTMEEVVVRGQATGQRAAINRQISSNTIVNVVSQEKLQELPDQNAAEAVGRLAGVSVYRDAGEGQRISVRGISPRFNAITINGERLASTEESERSVDLSMISPDMLAGIELFKAIRPDMDGDAIGGTVNFTVAKAEDGFRFNARGMPGYNDLRNDFGQFRGNFSVSNRFLDQKIGIIATGNYQVANRSNESLVTDYVYEGVNQNGDPILSVSSHNLSDKLETRKRYGGSLTFDWSPAKDHAILLNSSVGRTDRDELRYRRRYRIADNYHEFDIRDNERQITLTATNLSGEHHFKNLDVTWRGSLSNSRQDNPYQLTGRFRELAAIGSAIQDDRDIASLNDAFKHNLENTILYDSRFNTTEVREDRITAQLDLRYNFTINKSINGYIKTGGKLRDVKRNRDTEGVFISPYLPGENPATGSPSLFLTNNGGQILLANFIGDYTNDGFYDGTYDLLPGTPDIRQNFTTSIEGVNIDQYNELFGTNYQLGDQIAYRGHIDLDKIQRFRERFASRYRPDLFINSGDYEGGEQVLASYLMTELNLGKRITLMGGARYEATEQEYTSFIVTGDVDNPDEPIDVSVTSKTEGRVYDELLPMAHLKYKVAPWMDVRAAVTKTLARPNFFNIVPWSYVNPSSREVQYGVPELLHTTAWNYDLFLSFYNKFGLFTVGGFYKELKNIDFIASSIETDPESVHRGWSVTEPRNNTGTSTVRGVEFDFQTNLSSLNNFLSGIVLGANLTLSKSKTFYPLFVVETVFVGPPTFFETRVLDSLRQGPIVGQADVLANINLGYEKGGFSGRISMIYQSDALSPGNPGIGSSESGVGTLPELDYFDQANTRFDVAIRQQLDRKGTWTVLLNLNNISNTPERSFLGLANRLKDEEFYGMTADLGVILKIR